MADKNVEMQERNATNTGWDNIYPVTKIDNIKDAAGNSHMADYIRQPGYGVTAGSANTYTLTLSPALITYAAGVCVAVKIHAANTGASTLNVNGLGAKSILDSKGNTMTSGKLRLNGIYTLRYDGTNFTLQGEGGSGNAIASDLLAGKTASTDAGDITGTMPINGPATAETVNLTTEGAEYTIAAGNHSGLRKIKAVISGLIASVVKAGTMVGGILGTFTNDATATASQMLSGATVWVKGVLVTGNIPSKAAATYNPSIAAQTIAAGQYLNGTQTIAATTGTATDADVRAGKTYNSAAGIGRTGTLDTTVPHGEQVYSVGGTYTWVPPAGVTKCWVTLASGGGGGCAGDGNYGGTGGGGSIQVVATPLSCTPGTGMTVVCGAGGNRGADMYVSGQTGGTSSFGGYSVPGGTGGQGGLQGGQNGNPGNIVNDTNMIGLKGVFNAGASAAGVTAGTGGTGGYTGLGSNGTPGQVKIRW